jgi:hypothetical protein
MRVLARPPGAFRFRMPALYHAGPGAGRGRTRGKLSLRAGGMPLAYARSHGPSPGTVRHCHGVGWELACGLDREHMVHGPEATTA